MRRFSLFAVFMLFLPAVSFADMHSDAADEYCKCAGPMLKDSREMMGLMSGGGQPDMAKMQQLMAKVQGRQGELEACMNKLEEKYKEQKDDDAFSQKVTAQIEKKCPAPKLPMQ